MKKLFDDLSFQVSKSATRKYSTSFSLGIRALDKEIRSPIYAIYGFVRLADEIVDSFQGFNKKELLGRLKLQTAQAIDERISLNPILNSFQQTVHKYNIGVELIERFFQSMEMDLHPLSYTTELYKEYILGSAEVVGLMCLNVFVEGNPAAYMEMEFYAMKLGSAFQKVNFLRDINYDYSTLGRTYFPGLDLRKFDTKAKSVIEKEISDEFKQALIGIKKLPSSSRFGVYLAYKYYLVLFIKIRKTPANKILNSRIRISNASKITLMISSYVQFKILSI
jgi:phytoene synthase